MGDITVALATDDLSLQLPALAPLVETARRAVRRCTGSLAYPDVHTIAVARLAIAVASRVAPGPSTLREVAEGALLHDVGKLDVDERILGKPGPLTLEELAEVQLHPARGEGLLRGAVGDASLAVIRSHHERWDGRGYPDGLRGPETPLAARAVAIADAYIAMREDRPYRRALSEDEALAEIVRASGSQFDPACVAALREMTEQAHAD
jgi:HD-GYP domain-containing protein (c-di-GMP phosphodiesterase class II)